MAVPKDATAPPQPRTQRIDTGDPGFDPAEGPAIWEPGGVIAERYVIRELSGEGSGGAVFRADDLALCETVALKVLAPPLTEEAIDRFRREVRLTRKIAHPHVVRVYDLLTLPGQDGHVLSMQWIDGTTLRERVVMHGPLSARAALKLFRGLASALAAAHRLGIVHRDVKPANVMLDAMGEPLLLDFGIASEPGALPVRASTPDGTVGFMSPEQEAREAMGPPADLYSLGLTVAFALGLDEKTLGRAPVAIRAPLARCLARDPKARYPSGAELERDLARASLRVWRLPAAAVVAAALVAGVGMAWMRRAPVHLAIEPFTNDTGAPEADWRARGAADLIAADLVDGPRVRLDWPLEGAAPRGAMRVQGGIEGNPPVLHVRLLDERGSARAEHRTPPGLDLYVQAKDAVQWLRGAARLSAGAGTPPTSNPDALRAYEEALLSGERHREGSLDSLRHALAIDPGFARAAALLFLRVQADGHGSRPEARAALETALAAPGARPAGDRRLLEAVAAAPDFAPFHRYLDENPGDAAAWLIAARLARGAERSRILEDWIRTNPLDPEPHNLRGYERIRAGDVAGAEAEMRQAIALAPKNAQFHDSLADLLHHQARLGEARAAARTAVELAPDFSTARVREIELALADDDYGTAERLLAEVRAGIGTEAPAYERLLRAGASLWMFRQAPKAALDYLSKQADQAALGTRRFAVREMEALVLAAARDPEGLDRAGAEAIALARDYKAAAVEELVAYARALAVFEDANRFPAAADALHRLWSAPGEHWPIAAEPLFQARLEALGGNARGAIDSLVRAGAPRLDGSNMGAPFLQSLYLARLLSSEGRLGEARAWYTEAIRRHDTHLPSPESADQWRPCLSEAAALFGSSNDAQAAALRSRLARVSGR